MSKTIAFLTLVILGQHADAQSHPGFNLSITGDDNERIAVMVWRGVSAGNAEVEFLHGTGETIFITEVGPCLRQYKWLVYGGNFEVILRSYEGSSTASRLLAENVERFSVPIVPGEVEIEVIHVGVGVEWQTSGSVFTALVDGETDGLTVRVGSQTHGFTSGIASFVLPYGQYVADLVFEGSALVSHEFELFEPEPADLQHVALIGLYSDVDQPNGGAFFTRVYVAQDIGREVMITLRQGNGASSTQYVYVSGSPVGGLVEIPYSRLFRGQMGTLRLEVSEGGPLLAVASIGSTETEVVARQSSFQPGAQIKSHYESHYDPEIHGPGEHVAEDTAVVVWSNDGATGVVTVFADFGTQRLVVGSYLARNGDSGTFFVPAEWAGAVISTDGGGLTSAVLVLFSPDGQMSIPPSFGH